MPYNVVYIKIRILVNRSSATICLPKFLCQQESFYGFIYNHRSLISPLLTSYCRNNIINRYHAANHALLLTGFPKNSGGTSVHRISATDPIQLSYHPVAANGPPIANTQTMNEIDDTA